MGALVRIGDTHPTVFKWFADIITAEFKSRLTEDLASQLDLCGISSMDRIGNYEFSDNCSIQLSRAIYAISSVGRAQSLQVWGRRFETVIAYHPYETDWHSVR